MKALHRLFVPILLALLAAACAPPKVVTFDGPTMGTHYHITVVNAERRPVPPELQAELESILEDVNRSMSTYREDSLITRFNGAAPGAAIAIDPHFAAVLSTALEVGAASRGAYDVTAAPLVNLWGFGPEPRSGIPDNAAIAAAKSRTGMQWLAFDPQAATLAKRRPVTLDFSSVAKGYAVDLLAAHLRHRGFADYMVEIGGELKVSGRSPRGEAWRIAIEQPAALAAGTGVGVGGAGVDGVRGGGRIAATLALEAQSVATSGDYRNYFEADGIRYSHLIDPRTGWPARHDLVSVTVVHPDCATADAWATALSILGSADALETATAHNLAAYLITRAGETRRTPAIEPFLR